ncbi:hypothetical protein M0657_006002 [Pyricularia oryzae]|nr:hypothetical protein M0657_006002 [Pyricularia oryzae]KAI7926171.1 hypothetical protein M9X92_002916 [Pyricularia oryzae]
MTASADADIRRDRAKGDTQKGDRASSPRQDGTQHWGSPQTCRFLQDHCQVPLEIQGHVAENKHFDFTLINARRWLQVWWGGRFNQS